jgi:hypothetical protein
MNRLKFTIIIFLSFSLIISLLLTPSVLAQDEKDNEMIKVDVEKFPELTCNKYSVFEGDNLLDPESPNYDPSLKYGPEGTRFGPPGKRNLDFYREKGMIIDERSAFLEEDLKDEQPWPGDADYGTALRSGMGVEFTQAYQKIYTTINLYQDGDLLYAPTLLGPDDCRLESFAMYVRKGITTYRLWGIFEHSTTTPGGGSFPFQTPMDATFCTRYGGGANEVITRVSKTSATPTWAVYLYDRIDSEWDQIGSTSTGTRCLANSDGWDAWEEWNFAPYWIQLPQITSRYLLVQVSGTPYFVTNTYGYVIDNGSMPYPKTMVSNYYHWSVGPGP